MNSEKLFAESKKVMPGGVSSPVRAFKPYPFFVEKRGVKFNYDSLVVKENKKIAIYLENEIGGFAFHLMKV